MNLQANTPASQIYLRATVLLAILMSIGFSWLVIAAGALRPSFINALIQILVIAIIISLLVLVIRRFQRTRHQLQAARANAEAEAKLLRDRSSFIYAASSKLSSKLAVFEKEIAGLNPADKHAAPLIKKTAELRKLLNRLDTISKLEASMALTSTSKIDIAKALNEVATHYQAAFTAKGARLQISVPKGLSVSADAAVLTEVIASIVDNAAKFVPASTGLLDVNVRRQGRQVRFVFTDNGPGVDPAKLPQLFKPFSRADGVMKFDYQGQGLSLYIDKLCVEILGGSIDLNSNPGKGTTVTIILPLGR